MYLICKISLRLAAMCLLLTVVVTSGSFHVLQPEETLKRHSTFRPASSKSAIGMVVQIEPDWDLAAQSAPDYEVDQRVSL